MHDQYPVEITEETTIVEHIGADEAYALLYSVSEQKNIRPGFAEYVANANKMKAPSIKFSVDDPKSPISRAFNLDFTLFGFNITNINNNGVQAYTIFNKNLAKDFPIIDIEFLRGLAALAIASLENKLNQHIDIHCMIYSPRFTEFLYNCLEYVNLSK